MYSHITGSKSGEDLKMKKSLLNRPDIPPENTRKGILRLQQRDAPIILKVNNWSNGELQNNSNTKRNESPVVEEKTPITTTNTATKTTTTKSETTPTTTETTTPTTDTVAVRQKKKKSHRGPSKLNFVDLFNAEVMKTSEKSSKESKDDGLRENMASVGKNNKDKMLKSEGGKKKKMSKLKRTILNDRIQRWNDMNPEQKIDLLSSDKTTPSPSRCRILVRNRIQIEEVVDDDEYEEVLEEVKDQFSEFGEIVSIVIPRNANEDGAIVIGIEYSDSEAATLAIKETNERIFGGQQLAVEYDQILNQVANQVPVRVPKIPSTTLIRSYVRHKITDEMNAVVTELLEKLMLYQQRGRMKDPLKAKKMRRLVIGLREVKRGIKLGKIKCVIISSNIDECPSANGLDDNVNGIIQASMEQGIRVIYALTRKKLGKAVGSTIRISVVGIYRFDGAYEIYTQIQSIHDALLQEPFHPTEHRDPDPNTQLNTEHDTEHKI